jgi:hypothetical protein
MSKRATPRHALSPAKQARREAKRERRAAERAAAVESDAEPAGTTSSTDHARADSAGLIDELDKLGWYAERRIFDGCTKCEGPVEFVPGSIRPPTAAEMSAPTIMGLPPVIAFERSCQRCSFVVLSYLAKDPITYRGADAFEDAGYRQAHNDVYRDLVPRAESPPIECWDRCGGVMSVVETSLRPLHVPGRADLADLIWTYDRLCGKCGCTGSLLGEEPQEDGRSGLAL